MVFDFIGVSSNDKQSFSQKILDELRERGFGNH